jgi:hypothetical protein
MQYQGPGERIQKIQSLLQQVYLPLAPMIQAQGGSIDVAALTSMYAEMLDIPRLKDVIAFNQPIQPPAQAEGPTKSPVSNRNYTRRNVSGDSSGMSADQWIQQAEMPQT